MKTDLELRQLRYFVVVAEELNFTRAAERLQIAQPPLSRQIQSLEKTLDVELLQRTNRRVALTAAGQVFLTECQQILSRVEQSIHKTQRVARGEVGQLTIGFEGAFHHDTVLDIIQKFRGQFSEVELVLQEMPSGQQMGALQQQVIDVGFVDPILTDRTVARHNLFSEPLVAVLASTHHLAQEKNLNLNQLAKESWITGRSGAGCGLLQRIMTSCQQAGFNPNVQQETNDIQMTLGFVASGLGITLLPVSALIPQPPGITACEITFPISEVELAITWEPQNKSPVLKMFLALVQSLFP
ncbi:MAG: LysR substrate-binding domain-containing protein [Cyanobacteria bacterium P01_H01_bin.15]